MNKKVIIAILVILLIAAFAWAYNNSKNSDTSETNDSQTTTPTEQPVATDTQTEEPAEEQPAPTPPKTNQSGGTFSDEEDIVSPDISVFEVTYDGSSFSPSSLSIKLGDIVFFKNNGSKPFEPASDPHPTHTNYPAFDAKSAIPAGGKFEFKFTKVGSWGYHDHLNTSAKGTIIVTN